MIRFKEKCSYDTNYTSFLIYCIEWISVIKTTCFPLEAQACIKRSKVEVTRLYWNLQRALQIFIPNLCVSFKMDIRVSFSTPQPQNTYLELDTTELSWNANLQYRIETSHAILPPNNCALHMIDGTWATCFKWHRHHYHHRIENRALVVPCFNDNILTTVVFSLHPRAADFMGLCVASVPRNVRLYPLLSDAPRSHSANSSLPTQNTHAHGQSTLHSKRTHIGCYWATSVKEWHTVAVENLRRAAKQKKIGTAYFSPLFFTTPNCAEKFHQLTAAVKVAWLISFYDDPARRHFAPGQAPAGFGRLRRRLLQTTGNRI